VLHLAVVHLDDHLALPHVEHEGAGVVLGHRADRRIVVRQALEPAGPGLDVHSHVARFLPFRIGPRRHPARAAGAEDRPAMRTGSTPRAGARRRYRPAAFAAARTDAHRPRPPPRLRPPHVRRPWHGDTARGAAVRHIEPVTDGRTLAPASTARQGVLAG